MKVLLLLAGSWLLPGLDGTVLEFPRDHGAHPGHKTEWWYWTGRLTDDRNRRYGFQVTFFRRALPLRTREPRSRWDADAVVLGHAALGEVSVQRFRYAERAGRTAMGRAWSAGHRLSVGVGPWQAHQDKDRILLKIPSRDWSLDLELRESRRPMIHGPAAYSRKSDQLDQGSRYYSQPRLSVKGWIETDEGRRPARGEAWLDREWTSTGLGPDGVGWDWFSLTLADGRDVMIYVLRDKQGRFLKISKGSLRHADGRHHSWTPSRDTLHPTRYWTSPHSGIRYPAGWSIVLPGDSVPLIIQPELPDQELRTTRTTGVTYWEGLVSARRGDRPAGWGFVELTGYGKSGSPRL
ncbi:MAG: lipocalin-like domain-containing protein [Candidatus Sericytochromatia bacterium]|nr:lipocalin-like domain-containing protein [Candidatus Sericytochromatia bacterium]